MRWFSVKSTQTLNDRIRAIACSALLMNLANADTASLTEFDGKEEPTLDWRVVDDGVMGGLSKGRVSISDEGILTFKGTLSLENNGGFSSIRTNTVELDLGASQGISARVRGDGRSYQMRLGTDALYRGREVSFTADFATEEGEWTTVKVPFEKFTGSFRGMKLKEEVLDPEKIRRLGLLLGDKKAGPFELEVDWIRAYGSEEHANTIIDAALADGRFTTLATALGAADLVEVLQGEGPFTVFAPTDEAFAKLPKEAVANLLKPENRAQLAAVLTYHVVPGAVKLSDALAAGKATTVQEEEVTIAFAEGRVRVNESPILDADLTCSNGVIHVIESVMLPPTPEPANDLLAVAKRSGNFTTLLAALDATGLTDALSEEGPFTILAPTDEAFAALPEGTIESLLKEENREKLRSILAYHALAGNLSAGDVLNAQSAQTLNGKSVTFAIEDGLLKADEATLRQVDLECSNGRIHVLDSVLLPPTTEAEKEETKHEKQVSPLSLIEEAISQGVPVFNKGGHAECATIYRNCLSELSQNEELAAPLQDALKKLLAEGKEEENDTDRAWFYRQCLDVTAMTLKQSHE